MKQKITILFLSFVILLSACAPKPQAVQTLKIAVLPIIDALPMYVAQQEGLFARQGVNVEFVPVASAPERDQLVAAGGADGTINETLAEAAENPVNHRRSAGCAWCSACLPHPTIGDFYPTLPSKGTRGPARAYIPPGRSLPKGLKIEDRGLNTRGGKNEP